MNERWVRIEAVLREAVSRPPGERTAFVDAACEGDSELRHEVTSLLAQEADAHSFLEQPVLAASLNHGDRIGAYRIEERLGAGGMGEVYRARDTVLDREVAIKILSPALAGDADSFARLGREARMLAAVSHPHIASVYGLEESNGLRALVMELLDGETLAERLSRGRLSIADALRIGAQLADALAAAHERDLVHRDVKPGNIQITATGTVKVLDFGLAKATRGVGARTTIATRDGSVMGTPAYMSPEQTRGETVDKQTDVWAFGCVLFEMLSGVRAFDAPTASDVTAAVLEHEPPWSALPPTTPGSIVVLLRQCLQKEKKRRLRDLRDAHLFLESAPRMPASAPEHASAGRIRAREGVAWILVALVATVAILLLLRREASPRPPVTRFEITPPDGQSITNIPAISPDGSQLVFVAEDSNRATHLWVRRLDADDASMISGTEGASFPFWSPDSHTIAFFAGGKLERIDLDGGPPVEIADAPAGRGGAWDRDVGIIFAPSTTSGLVRIAKPGAAPVEFTTLRSGEGSHRGPFFSGNGYFGYYVMTKDPSESGIWVAPVDAPGSARRILRTSDAAQYSSGHLFFIRNDTLVAQRFDPERSQLMGDPIAVADNVASSGSGVTALPSVAVSFDGSVVTRRSRPASARLTWLSRDGRSMESLAIPPAPVKNPEVSPDGSRLAYQIGSRWAGELWAFDRRRRAASRASISGPGVLAPLWFPDGSRLVVTSARGIGGNGNLYEIVPEGGSPRPVAEAQAGMIAIGWVSDRLLFMQTDAPPWGVIKMLTPKSGAAPYFDPGPQALFATARVSPDGRAIAYTSNQSGRPEVYLIGYPSPRPVRPVSTAGGAQPRWRQDSRELFYLALDGKLMSVPVKRNGESLELGVPTALQTLRISGTSTEYYQYDVLDNGNRFVAAIDERPPISSLTVIRNWASRHLP